MDRNFKEDCLLKLFGVATREGGVDRNTPAAQPHFSCVVATREGGVDRNPYAVEWPTPPGVATREGGVDRNTIHDLIDSAWNSRHPRGWRG